VFDPGRYFWGVGKSVLTFKRTYQRLSLEALNCFTNTGVQIELNVTLQWRYTQDLLPKSYKAYGLDVTDSVQAIAIASIKNNSTGWNTTQYFTNRSLIGAAFQQQVQQQVGSLLFVEVVALQLLDVNLVSDAQIQRYLDAANQIQSNDREAFVQEATLVRTNTTNLQQQALADIAVINATANYNVSILLAQANAIGLQTVTQARQQALQNLFDTLDLNTTELRLNYLYITAMGNRAANGLKTSLLADLPTSTAGI